MQMGAVKAILLGLALLITGICGWTLMTLPCFPLLFINVSLYRFMNDCSLQLWYKVVPVSLILFAYTSKHDITVSLLQVVMGKVIT